MRPQSQRWRGGWGAPAPKRIAAGGRGGAGVDGAEEIPVGGDGEGVAAGALAADPAEDEAGVGHKVSAELLPKDARRHLPSRPVDLPAGVDAGLVEVPDPFQVAADACPAG